MGPYITSKDALLSACCPDKVKAEMHATIHTSGRTPPLFSIHWWWVCGERAAAMPIVAPLTGLFHVPCLLNPPGIDWSNSSLTQGTLCPWYLHPSSKSTDYGCSPKGRIWCNSVGHQVAILKIRKYFTNISTFHPFLRVSCLFLIPKTDGCI